MRKMSTTTAAIWFGVLALTAACVNASAMDWQQRRLLHPSNSELTKEAHGQVFIYDGMHSKQIDNAIDDNFDRIQNMMFIRTQIGEGETAMVQDDGC